MSDIFVTYPGGKNGSGTYQKIINLMPPHHTYVEAFLGGGAILRAKRPAAVNIGIDLDRRVVREWNFVETHNNVPNLRIYWADALAWLTEHSRELGPDCLVYADPPYLMSTRSSQRQFYTVEMAEEHQHRALIEVLKGLRCMVMLSGYWSSLYAELLATWRTFSFQAMTRGGTLATEWVWMNFPEPFALHDYRFLGSTFRERERIKRKESRWVERLKKMPALERQALLHAIQEVETSGSSIETSGDTADRGDGYRCATPEGAMPAGTAEADDDDMDGPFPSGTVWRKSNGDFEMPVEIWKESDCSMDGNDEGTRL